MAVRFEEGTTPGGAPLQVMHLSGLCELADARALDPYIKPGGRYHRQRVLVYVAAGTEYTSEARRHFPTLNHDHHAMALVVTSAIVRAAINLMSRVAGGPRNFRLFTDAGPALAWLDAAA